MSYPTRLLLAALVVTALPLNGQKVPTLDDLLPNRSEIGPLVLTGVKDAWLSVRWSPSDAYFMRRINGLIPKEDDTTPLRIKIRSSHIGPRFDSDQVKRANYLKQYEDAFRTILAEKTFWFRTVSANTNVPDTTWITGVLTFDGIGSVRLEKDLVRSGAAVVRHRDEAAFTESFRDDYRDELLRLEGMARLEKKGVWASE